LTETRHIVDNKRGLLHFAVNSPLLDIDF